VAALKVDVAALKTEIVSLKTAVVLLKWMMGVQISMILAILLKLVLR
jgi:hypothetical protein